MTKEAFISFDAPREESTDRLRIQILFVFGHQNVSKYWRCVIVFDIPMIRMSRFLVIRFLVIRIVVTSVHARWSSLRHSEMSPQTERFTRTWVARAFQFC